MPRNVSNPQPATRTTLDEQIELHLKNINLLSTIVRDSHGLIEEQQYTIRRREIAEVNILNNILNPPTTQMQSGGDTHTAQLHPNTYTHSQLFHLIVEPFATSDDIIPTSNMTDISLQYMNIDSNNTNILNDIDISSNNTVHIYNIAEFGLINDPLNDMCPITRDRFYINQSVAMINKCRHIFNKSALNIWLDENNTCPTCRCNVLEHE